MNICNEYTKDLTRAVLSDMYVALRKDFYTDDNQFSNVDNRKVFMDVISMYDESDTEDDIVYVVNRKAISTKGFNFPNVDALSAVGLSLYEFFVASQIGRLCNIIRTTMWKDLMLCRYIDSAIDDRGSITGYNVVKIDDTPIHRVVGCCGEGSSLMVETEDVYECVSDIVLTNISEYNDKYGEDPKCIIIFGGAGFVDDANKYVGPIAKDHGIKCVKRYTDYTDVSGMMYCDGCDDLSIKLKVETDKENFYVTLYHLNDDERCKQRKCTVRTLSITY